MSTQVTINGHTYTFDDDFKNYGYLAKFPALIADILSVLSVLNGGGGSITPTSIDFPIVTDPGALPNAVRLYAADNGQASPNRLITFYMRLPSGDPVVLWEGTV